MGIAVQVPSVSTTFTAVDDAGNGGMHPEVTMTPPLAPQVFTTFLLGSSEYGYTLVPQVDAPECTPRQLVETFCAAPHFLSSLDGAVLLQRTDGVCKPSF